MPTTPRRLSLLTALLYAAACAGSDDPSPIPAPDMVADMADQAADLAPDLAPDLPPDLPPDMEVDMRCGVCCPEDKMCAASGAAAQCKPDGTGFVETPCGADQECMAGACVTKQVCQPGETMCFDASTQLVCRQNGSGYATQSCMGGTSCINGDCVSGEINGATCAADADCAGGKCHCSAGEQCPAAFSAAYCTAPCGPQGGCGPSEWCLASSVHALPVMAASYDHCVTKCMGMCPLPGMACKVIPVYDAAGEVSWEEGCYYPQAKQVGEVCTNDAECLGGRCLQGYYANSGVCSLRCEDTSCPDDAACVELVPGQLWCSQLCGDGAANSTAPCPLDVPNNRFDVACQVRQSTDRGGVRVCSKT